MVSSIYQIALKTTQRQTNILALIIYKSKILTKKSQKKQQSNLTLKMATNPPAAHKEVHHAVAGKKEEHPVAGHHAVAGHKEDHKEPAHVAATNTKEGACKSSACKASTEKCETKAADVKPADGKPADVKPAEEAPKK